MRWPIAMIALVAVALLSSVATVGAERLITGADIKDGSITGRDIKAGSIDIKRIEEKGRNAVYRSRKLRPSTRSNAYINEKTATNIASVSVPAGEYVIQGSVSVENGVVNSATICYISDTAGKLGEGNYSAEWLNQVGTEQMFPLTVVATASYTTPVTLYLTCYGANAGMWGQAPSLIAEQVSLVN